MRLLRLLAALALASAPIVAVMACNNQVNTAATKPMSPADGAGDYKTAGGPHEKPVVPTGSSEPSATGSVGPMPGPSNAVASGSASASFDNDCPPKCAKDGSWFGCGLKKPRGSKCDGCTPQCKSKGKIDEGWYDCAGLLIAQRSCS